MHGSYQIGTEVMTMQNFSGPKLFVNVHVHVYGMNSVSNENHNLI